MYQYHVKFTGLAKKGNEEKVLEGAIEIPRDEKITHFLEVEIIKETIIKHLKNIYNYSHYRIFINSYQLL